MEDLATPAPPPGLLENRQYPRPALRFALAGGTTTAAAAAAAADITPYSSLGRAFVADTNSAVTATASTTTTITRRLYHRRGLPRARLQRGAVMQWGFPQRGHALHKFR